MSFESLRAPQLREVVKQFVGEQEARDAKNKNELIAILAEEGVTYGTYQAFADAENVTADEVKMNARAQTPDEVKEEFAKGDKIVLKMERENGTFQCFGVTFTKDHPYAVVDEDTANSICTTFTGFRPALPKEVQDYYS